MTRLTFRKAEALLNKAGELLASGEVPTDAPIGFDVGSMWREEFFAECGYFYEVYQGDCLYVNYRTGDGPSYGEVGPLELSDNQIAVLARHMTREGIAA